MKYITIIIAVLASMVQYGSAQSGVDTSYYPTIDFTHGVLAYQPLIDADTLWDFTEDVNFDNSNIGFRSPISFNFLNVNLDSIRLNYWRSKVALFQSEEDETPVWGGYFYPLSFTRYEMTDASDSSYILADTMTVDGELAYVIEWRNVRLCYLDFSPKVYFNYQLQLFSSNKVRFHYGVNNYQGGYTYNDCRDSSENYFSAYGGLGVGTTDYSQNYVIAVNGYPDSPQFFTSSGNYALAGVPDNGQYYDIHGYIKKEIGLNELTKMDFSVYPNPAQSILHITSDNVFSGYISLFTAQGMEVLKTNTAKIATIDVSEIPPGIYFLQISDSQGRRSGAKKIVIQ
ncbi:MAG: hypothetical protein ACI8ZO_000422 [Flavobacteriales bacterium]|jgi:hypothetical protein